MSLPPCPQPLDQAVAARALALAAARGGDDHEVFAEYTRLSSLTVEEGKVKAANLSVQSGVAVRVVHGETQGLAFCETGAEADIYAAAHSAAAIAQGAAGKAATLAAQALPSRYVVQQSGFSSPITERIALAQALHDAAAQDPLARFVSAHLVVAERWITVARSDGTWAVDYQPMLRSGLSALLVRGERRERGYRSVGRRCGLELFQQFSPEHIAQEALRQAHFKLDAEPCPAGAMPVVCAAGGAGVLVHEAVGHGLEADFNRKGVSAYAGKLGSQVASPLVSIYDEGESPSERGCLNIDDEGTPVGSTSLIEHGTLCGYLSDRLNARLMGLPATGNGRRESYRHLVIPRMRITGMRSGKDDPQDIIAQVKHGLYAVAFGGGSVDISKGDYNFEVEEAWIIENGKLSRPVRGATLVGNGPETLKRVSRVGTDACIDQNAGTCGKDGQGVPVSFATPTFLVDELVVGGAA